MPLIDAQGRLLGKFNVLDAGLVLLLLLVGAGLFAVQSGMHATSSAIVKGETDIDIRVMFRIRSEEAPLFKPGDTTNITIRNQPRGKVKIIAVEQKPVQTMLAINGTPQAVTDATEMHVSDYWVTLRDHATITDEGYVAEGVKMKIGQPIDLEGFKYWVHGGIIDVKPTHE